VSPATIDHAISVWIQAHRTIWLNTPLAVLSTIARFGALWLTIALLLAAARRISWRDAGRVLMAFAITMTVNDYVIKPIVNRERPFLKYADVAAVDRRPESSSFPSGHAAGGVAAALVLSNALPAGRLVWWTLAALIAFSRLYLGVHFASDIVAGALLGFLVSAATLRLTGLRSLTH
jgi:undecaprenyl-diphosphatase